MKKKVRGHTRRYRETEKKLLAVAYKISSPLRKTRITVTELVYKAGTGTSTFYYHFRNLLDFSRRHEHITIHAAEKLFAEISTKRLSQEALFFKINMLIYAQRASVRLLLAHNNDTSIRRIFWIMKPMIIQSWSSYGRVCDKKIYYFFVAQVTEAVRIWVVGYNFRQNYIDDITKQMVFISKTIAPALAPLMKMEDEKGLEMVRECEEAASSELDETQKRKVNSKNNNRR